MLSIAPFSLGGRMGVIRPVLPCPQASGSKQLQELILLTSYVLGKGVRSGGSFLWICGA